VIVVGSAGLGALLPDADRAGARLYRRTPIERRLPLLRPLGPLARLPLRVLIVLPHRGPTHSLFGCAVAAGVAAALAALVARNLAPLVRGGRGDRLPRPHRGRRVHAGRRTAVGAPVSPAALAAATTGAGADRKRARVRCKRRCSPSR
jgi:hypothetical protein